MNNEVSDWIGYRWLAQRYGVSPVQAFRIDSAIARSRATVRRDGYTHQYYPSSARPADTLAAHLGFALKHEGVHLEFLARLFDVAPVIEGPDGDIDRIIRSVRENAGKLPNKLLKEFPALADDALAGEVLAAIEVALAPPGKP